MAIIKAGLCERVEELDGMEGAWKLKVSLEVDIGKSKNWAEAH
ncbi:MAG: hypothetical protein ACM3SR_17335 [Ignavibacteriales bacterium]